MLLLAIANVTLQELAALPSSDMAQMAFEVSKRPLASRRSL